MELLNNHKDNITNQASSKYRLGNGEKALFTKSKFLRKFLQKPMQAFWRNNFAQFFFAMICAILCAILCTKFCVIFCTFLHTQQRKLLRNAWPGFVRKLLCTVLVVTFAQCFTQFLEQSNVEFCAQFFSQFLV